MFCIFFRQIRHIVNKRDDSGSTALHYAVRTWPETAVRALLDLGANLGLKNGWGEVPLSRISVKCLKDFLDQVGSDTNRHNAEIRKPGI